MLWQSGSISKKNLLLFVRVASTLNPHQHSTHGNTRKGYFCSRGSTSIYPLTTAEGTLSFVPSTFRPSQRFHIASCWNFLLSLTNVDSEANPNNNLMMRQAVSFTQTLWKALLSLLWHADGYITPGLRLFQLIVENILWVSIVKNLHGPIMWSLNNHRHEYFPHKVCRKLYH